MILAYVIFLHHNDTFIPVAADRRAASRISTTIRLFLSDESPEALDLAPHDGGEIAEEVVPRSRHIGGAWRISSCFPGESDPQPLHGPPSGPGRCGHRSPCPCGRTASSTTPG